MSQHESSPGHMWVEVGEENRESRRRYMSRISEYLFGEEFDLLVGRQ